MGLELVDPELEENWVNNRADCESEEIDEDEGIQGEFAVCFLVFKITLLADEVLILVVEFSFTVDVRRRLTNFD